MSCQNIMIVSVNGRSKNAPQMQEVLTKSGCIIKTRLGLHETENVCSDEGIIILQLCGEKEDISRLEKELNGLEGIKAKYVDMN